MIRYNKRPDNSDDFYSAWATISRCTVVALTVGSVLDGFSVQDPRVQHGPIVEEKIGRGHPRFARPTRQNRQNVLKLRIADDSSTKMSQNSHFHLVKVASQRHQRLQQPGVVA